MKSVCTFKYFNFFFYLYQIFYLLAIVSSVFIRIPYEIFEICDFEPFYTTIHLRTLCAFRRNVCRQTRFKHDTLWYTLFNKICKTYAFLQYKKHWGMRIFFVQDVNTTVGSIFKSFVYYVSTIVYIRLYWIGNCFRTYPARITNREVVF